MFDNLIGRAVFYSAWLAKLRQFSTVDRCSQNLFSPGNTVGQHDEPTGS
jgi:hypothetical protein